MYGALNKLASADGGNAAAAYRMHQTLTGGPMLVISLLHLQSMQGRPFCRVSIKALRARTSHEHRHAGAKIVSDQHAQQSCRVATVLRCVGARCLDARYTRLTRQPAPVRLPVGKHMRSTASPAYSSMQPSPAHRMRWSASYPAARAALDTHVVLSWTAC